MGGLTFPRVNPWATDLAPATLALGGLRTFRTAVCSHQMAPARLRVPVGRVRRQAALSCGGSGMAAGGFRWRAPVRPGGDLTNRELGINHIWTRGWNHPTVMEVAPVMGP